MPVQPWILCACSAAFPLRLSNKLIEIYITKLIIYYFNSVLNIRAPNSQFLLAEVSLRLGVGAHSDSDQ